VFVSNVRKCKTTLVELNIVTISVLVPIYSEEKSLPQTLPSIIDATNSLPEPFELLLLVDSLDVESKQICKAISDNSFTQIIEVPNRGKFAALSLGTSRAKGNCLISVDADAKPSKTAFMNISTPIIDNTGDICLGRPVIANREKTKKVEGILQTWANHSVDIWDNVRSSNPKLRWAISGNLFSIRKDLFPNHIVVQLIEDASLGLTLSKIGARFIYAQNAHIYIRAPSSYSDWCNQKIRTRIGWENLRILFPQDIHELDQAILKSYKKLFADRGFSIQALWMHDQILRLFAKVLVQLPKNKEYKFWKSVDSTKEW